MTVPIHLREILSVRFPDVDFTLYFTFIESLSKASVGHKHHILPRKEFPELTRDTSNIMRVSPADHFRAHYWLAMCASEFEKVFYLMANRKSVYQVAVDELPRYAEIYERGRVKLVEKTRALGRKNAESGQIQALGRKNAENGRIQGRKNVESGHMQALHRKNVESGHLDRIRRLAALSLTPEQRSKFGHVGGSIGGRISGPIQGRKNVESGHIQELGRIQGCKNVENGHIQSLGRAQGRKNIENGHLARITVLGGRAASHIRWHVRRGIINPNCRLCHV